MQVAVALLDYLYLQPYSQPASMVAAHFAEELMDRWEVGYRGCKVGVVFLLATATKQVGLCSQTNVDTATTTHTWPSQIVTTGDSHAGSKLQTLAKRMDFLEEVDVSHCESTGSNPGGS